MQSQLAPCTTCDKFHSLSKRQRAKLNTIPTNDRGDILAIDVFGGKASLPETPLANRYILTMIDLFTKFGVAAPMPDQWRKQLLIPYSRDGFCSLEPLVA